MFEPQKETEPTIAANSDGIDERQLEAVEAAGLAELRPRDQRDRAAADAVEQRDHLRHRGHLHLARRGDADDRADDDGRRRSGPSCPSPRAGTSRRSAIAMPTAAMRLPRTAVRGPVSPRQPVDEQAEADDVEDVDEVRVLQEGRERHARPRAGSSHRSFGGAGLLLNISSMRSVTRKPPTTLIVPKMIAITSSDLVERRRGPRCSPSTRRPPSTTIPWIALVPDISGVCSVFGTFEMTAKPTKPASTRIARLVTNMWSPSPSAPAHRGLGALVDDLAVARDARPGDDLVVEVELDRRCRPSSPS